MPTTEPRRSPASTSSPSPRNARRTWAGLPGFAGLALAAASAAASAHAGGVAPAVTAAAPATAPSPAPAISAAAAARRPVISFDRLEHGFGSMWEGEQASTTFIFRNTGDATLVIQAIRASCGCTTTELDRMEFAPGEGDAITVTFDAKGRGEQRKTLTVVSNAGPPLRLDITASVRQFLSAEPAFLRLGDLELGGTRTARLRITSADPSFTPEAAVIRGAATRYVSARVVPADEAGGGAGGAVAAGPMLPGQSRGAGAAGGAGGAGTGANARGASGDSGTSTPPGPGAFDVEVTVAPGAPWGSLFANLRVIGVGTKPGDPAGRTRHTHDITVSGRVFGEVMASDTLVRVSRVPVGKPFRRVITFRSRSGEPLPMQSARLVNPSLPTMTATLEPEAGSEGRRWRLTVEADAGTVPGRVSGTLVVRTGVPGEEQLTFLVAGMVAAEDG